MQTRKKHFGRNRPAVSLPGMNAAKAQDKTENRGMYLLYRRWVPGEILFVKFIEKKGKNKYNNIRPILECCSKYYRIKVRVYTSGM